MRIISFSKKWDKLKQLEFTTFRFPRGDKDWYIGEIVQVFFKNRSPQREKLGDAKIVSKELRKIATAYESYRPTEEEAIADGFKNLFEMNTFLRELYGERIFEEPIHKLTLRWIEPPKVTQLSEGK